MKTTICFLLILISIRSLSQELASTQVLPAQIPQHHRDTFTSSTSGLTYTRILYPDRDCQFKGQIETHNPTKHLKHFTKRYRGFPETRDFSIYTNLLCYTDYANLEKDKVYAVIRAEDDLIFGYVRYNEEKKKFIISDPSALPIGTIMPVKGKYTVYDEFSYITSSTKQHGSNSFPWVITAGAILLVLAITGAVN